MRKLYRSQRQNLKNKLKFWIKSKKMSENPFIRYCIDFPKANETIEFDSPTDPNGLSLAICAQKP